MASGLALLLLVSDPVPRVAASPCGKIHYRADTRRVMECEVLIS